MKLRHPFFIKLAALFTSWIIRIWIGTLDYRYRPLGRNLEPRRKDLPGRYIYIFWHENLLLLAYHYGVPTIQVLISQHADGELIAQACGHLRLGTIRGSTSRGGAEALRRMLEASLRCHLAVVPDGPRGPRRTLQYGLVFLASRTGLPIVPVGVGYDRPWRANSWDRFALPRFWSRARTVSPEPIFVPPDLNRDQLEVYRQRVEAVMHHVTDLAERWAETGKWPGDIAGRQVSTAPPAEKAGRAA